MAETILFINNITFNYGGLEAVSGLSMHIERGKVTGLIGPNGAGKTTVFNLVCGVIHPLYGDITFKGRAIGRMPTHAIACMGLGRTFQNIQLFPSLTVREHLVLAQYGLAQSSLIGEVFSTPTSRRDRAKAESRSERIMERIGIEEYADELAVNLPYGLQRKVEFARAVVVGRELVLLDEPTAGMNIGESAAVMELIRGLVDSGITVLLVEHDMRVVMRSCSILWVMNQGSIIAHGTTEQIRNDPLVVEAYLGEPLAND
jgi:branched-chain amino acid transport system ATP-binding protein